MTSCGVGMAGPVSLNSREIGPCGKCETGLDVDREPAGRAKYAAKLPSRHQLVAPEWQRVNRAGPEGLTDVESARSPVVRLIVSVGHFEGPLFETRADRAVIH